MGESCICKHTDQFLSNYSKLKLLGNSKLHQSDAFLFPVRIVGSVILNKERKGFSFSCVDEIRHLMFVTPKLSIFYLILPSKHVLIKALHKDNPQ